MDGFWRTVLSIHSDNVTESEVTSHYGDHDWYKPTIAARGGELASLTSSIIFTQSSLGLEITELPLFNKTRKQRLQRRFNKGHSDCTHQVLISSGITRNKVHRGRHRRCLGGKSDLHSSFCSSQMFKPIFPSILNGRVEKSSYSSLSADNINEEDTDQIDGQDHTDREVIWRTYIEHIEGR